jgi:uncharacterized membrane protein YoaK (UPF0700 family)
VDKQQLNQNTQDIAEIKGSINTIMTNHLAHLEKDMEKQSKLIDKIDSRLWWIVGLLIASVVIPAIIQGLGL